MLQRKHSGAAASVSVPSSVHETLRSPGEPLGPSTRAFLEPRFGHDFSRIRVHSDAEAARSARHVQAEAYTVGNDIVFAEGLYNPRTAQGLRLLAHELTHTVQQSATGASFLAGPTRIVDPGDATEREADAVADRTVSSASGVTAIRGQASGGALQRREAPSLPPGPVLPCEIANDSPGPVTENLLFPNGQATLSGDQQLQVENFGVNWRAAGASTPVRVDGFASVPGTDQLNWQLSCSRAMVVADVLMHPSAGEGIPASFIRTVAQGKTTAFGLEADNRRATIYSPSPQVKPATAIAAIPCSTLPRSIGKRGGCGSGTDFTSNDFPSISSTVKSAAVWAFRGQSILDLMATMAYEPGDGVASLGGAEGEAAFRHFIGGGGSPRVLPATNPLVVLAQNSQTFANAAQRVDTALAAQLVLQANAGTMECDALNIPGASLPGIGFGFSDGVPLKAVIGGTQGLEVFLVDLDVNTTFRTYQASLRFDICDDFGVDEDDLYSPSLIAFWLLQHEHAGFLPFVHQFSLSKTLWGRF